MSQDGLTATQLRFGVFEVDLEARELRRAGIKIRIQPQSFEILAILVLRSGQIVTREELRQRLWPPDTFVDFEHSLNAAVKRLRLALSDDANTPRYIETIPRQGYRMIFPVVEISRTASPAIQDEIPFKSLSRWLIWVSVVLLVLCAAGYFAFRHMTQSHPQRVLLAVLPFDGLDEGEEAYFSAGLTEELITDLGQLNPGSLGVIARTSTMHYKGTEQTIANIGRDLGVAYVVEGNVHRVGDELRIASQLIRVSDQTQVWAHTYETNFENVFTLEAELAQGIANEISITVPDLGTLRAENERRHPANVEAQQLYMKGRYYWRRRYHQSLKVSQACFERAIQLDPNYALAYAGLADTYFLLAISGESLADDVMPLAKAAALTANQIDPNLAEAHTSLAQILANYDRNWIDAEREYKRAIELNTNYSTAHQWYATFLMNMGRSSEAIAEMRRALEIDPLSSIEGTFLAKAYYYNREYDKAIAQYRATLSVDPGFAVASAFLVQAYEQVAKYDEAIGEYRRQIPLAGGDPQSAAQYADQLAAAFKSQGAQGYWKKRLALADRTSWLERAGLYARLGENDEAFVALDHAYSQHDMWLVSLKVDPKWDRIRADQRFAAMLYRIGLN